jgi:hypothetical protein
MLRPSSTLFVSLQHHGILRAGARCVLLCCLTLGVAAEGFGQIPQNRMGRQQLSAATWTVQCTGGAGPELLLDTTFVGRVRLRRGGIMWQVTRETLTPQDAGTGDRAELSRRNYATGDCVVMSSPAGSDLIPRLNRPGQGSYQLPEERSDTASADQETTREDPRGTVPEEALPDSMYRRTDSTEGERKLPNEEGEGSGDDEGR